MWGRGPEKCSSDSVLISERDFVFGVCGRSSRATFSAPVEAKVWYCEEGDSSVRWFDWFFHCVFSEN